jgi:hypothetical protein
MSADIPDDKSAVIRNKSAVIRVKTGFFRDLKKTLDKKNTRVIIFTFVLLKEIRDLCHR